LPLWNFFKVVETGDLKFLLRVNDRFDYEKIGAVKDKRLADIWESIEEDFSRMNNIAVKVSNDVDKRKLLMHLSQYIEEQAMIRYLFIKTDMKYINELKLRGYKLDGSSKEKYWESLNVAAKRVRYHLSFMESLQLKLKPKDRENHENPFDQIMAWLASNDMKVDDNITVKRYIELKKIINNRIQALNKNGRRSNRT